MGYATKPWWTFAHVQRLDRFLTPVWQRLYPVGADLVPPVDFDALARWMARWGLLPPQLPATAGRDLAALISTPVEIVQAVGTPPSGSNEILRLPAEWEPSEAVVITWPILYPGLWRHRPASAGGCHL